MKPLFPLLVTFCIFLAACAQTENERLEAQAEAIQERAEALQELEDAKIDLALAEGKPLTPTQQQRYAEREAKKAWLLNGLKDYAVARALSPKTSVNTTVVH
jgi:hypothetical protein